MGYRSDVKIITTPEGWEKIDKAVRKVAGITKKNEEESYWLTERTYWTPICDGKYVLAEWEDIKWYEGRDEEIDALMNALKELKQRRVPYRYFRVGEDYGDVDLQESEPDYGTTEFEAIRDMPTLWLKQEIEVEYAGW